MSSSRRVKIHRIREELAKSGPVVGFDPGVVACGVAMFTSESFPLPAWVMSRKLREKQTRWCDNVAELVGKSIYSFKYTHCPHGVFVVEFPRIMAGLRGTASAARGDVFHLAHFCGLVHAEALMKNVKFAIQDAGQWKGQLSKNLVEQRLSRLIGTKDEFGNNITDHAWDACGIALAHMGVRMNDHQLLGEGVG